MEREGSGYHQGQTFISLSNLSPPALNLSQLTLSVGLIQPSQLARKKVGDREAATRTCSRVPNTALPALQDPNPVPFGEHT